MKKWMGSYITVFLLVLLVFGGIIGIREADKTDFGRINNEGGYISQLLVKEENDYIVYQNPGEGKFQILHMYKDLKDYNTIGTVHQGRVYYLYSYINQAKQMIGLEPIYLAGNEQWFTPVLEAEGKFLAAGSNETEIRLSFVQEDDTKITEYTFSPGIEDAVWQERTSFSLTETHKVVYGAYVGDVLVFMQENGKMFYCDTVIKEAEEELSNAILVSYLQNTIAEDASMTWKLFCVRDSMMHTWIPAAVFAAWVILLVYAFQKKYALIYRILAFTEVVTMAVLTIMGLCFVKGMENLSEEVIRKVAVVIIAAMVVVTLVHIILLVVFGSRWRKFVKAIQYVAVEKKAVEKVPTDNGGLQDMWTSLDVIGINMAKLNYERELVYRSYYRFVPKDMELLLQKPELAEVELGDSRRIFGCMVHFFMENIKDLDSSTYMQVMRESLARMHKVREKYGGIFLSAGADLLERKIFFAKNDESASRFAVDLLHAYDGQGILSDKKMMLMLHCAEYEYGVSGVEDMMTPYMYCADEKILEPYIKPLAEANVKIALTEQSLHLLGDGVSVRYIGFVTVGASKKLKIYECLDAYKENIRKVMSFSDSVFQSALQLFYSNDFYLARNNFNEVLKLNEQDQIARWYLFHCEYHLNHPDAEVSYGLFQD